MCNVTNSAQNCRLTLSIIVTCHSGAGLGEFPFERPLKAHAPKNVKGAIFDEFTHERTINLGLSKKNAIPSRKNGNPNTTTRQKHAEQRRWEKDEFIPGARNE